ncbi:unnamed protein product [Somion occarium]|uniref:Jacalin-type lectin domain-containing protein n=1 Tax=Somion occarium TaxID=3059160 RepID=A0ABP1DFA0_9APHY
MVHIYNMSAGINQTPTWGVTTSGQPFNDLDTVGATNLNKISKVVIGHGEVIDSITITYDRNDGLAPLVQSHGGTGGNITTIELDSNEVIVGVSGRYGFVSSIYGRSSIQSLEFALLNQATGEMRIEGPFAPGSGTPFSVIDTVVAVAGYVSTSGTHYIQALSFFTTHTPVV